MDFTTVREQLIQDAEARLAAGEGPYQARTLPYYSTTYLRAQIAEADGTHSFAYAVFEPQEIVWFDYGIGGRFDVAETEQKATRAETNLVRPHSTNGAFDFAISTLGVHTRPARIRIDPQNHGVGGATPGNASVLAALNGLAEIYDPTAIAVPQQLASPFFTGNVLFEAIRPFLAVDVTFDGQNYRQLGCLSNFARGAEAHPWHADATPPEDCSLEISEGLLWARDGEPDSDLSLRGRLERAVVVPISGVIAPGDGSTPTLPTYLYLPIVMTLFGLEIGKPSSN